MDDFFAHIPLLGYDPSDEKAEKSDVPNMPGADIADS